MAEIVANAKINSTKKPSYMICLTHLSPCRISKDAAEIARLEVLAAFIRLIHKLKRQLLFVGIKTDFPENSAR